MALEANGQRFCKVKHTENGRSTTRRIHTMMIQAADGRLRNEKHFRRSVDRTGQHHGPEHFHLTQTEFHRESLDNPLCFSFDGLKSAIAGAFATAQISRQPFDAVSSPAEAAR